MDPQKSPFAFDSIAVWSALAFLGLASSLAAQSVSAPPSDASGAASDQTVKLNAFEVSAAGDVGYGARNTVGGSRINTPLDEVPNYTTVLNETLLKDLGANEMMDALTLASGVTWGTQANQGDTQYSLRGYAVSGLGTRDGINEKVNVADVSADDSSLYDRIEIIKGPAGILYGTSSMGGIVNRVGKVPLSAPQTTLEVQAATGWDVYLRGMVDSTGPLDKDGRLEYRVISAWRDGEAAWGGLDSRQTNLAMLSYYLGQSKQTKVWGRFQYTRTNVNRSQGVFWADENGNMMNIFRGSYRLSVHDFPLDANSIESTHNYELGMENNSHFLGGDWTTRLIGRYSWGDGDQDVSYAGGTVTAYDSTGKALGTSIQLAWNDPRIADWRTTATVRNFEAFAQDGLENADAVGHYVIGPTDQTVIINVGDEWTAGQRTFAFWSVLFPNAPTYAPNSFSFFHPQADWGAMNYKTITAGRAASFNDNTPLYKIHTFHYAAQDNIALFGKKLIAVVGVRRDSTADTTYLLAPSLQPTSATRATNQDWTYKYGLIYKVFDGVSLFANYSTTYSPIYTTDLTGKKFPDQQGHIKEAGVKLDKFHGKLVATASVFDMSLTNVLVTVLNPPSLGGGSTLAPAGTQLTRGWEADVTAEPIPSVDLIASFSQIDSISATGLRFRDVPNSPTYNLLAKYTVLSGPLQRVAVGLKWEHIGERAGDAANTFTIREGNQIDGFVTYSPNRVWSIQVNVINIMNADNVWAGVTNTNVSIQPPTTVRFTTLYHF